MRMSLHIVPFIIAVGPCKVSQLEINVLFMTALKTFIIL